MDAEELRGRIPSNEIVFTASRSSGPGGQNINKVNTKVELRFNINKSEVLTANEKLLLFERLKKKINTDGDLIVVSQSERTQLMNKKKAEEKFFKLIIKALAKNPERIATTPSKASNKKRLEKKKKRSDIKKLRKDYGMPEEEL
ncbi:MAG: alternative ribosome rescue aminoacyl-tRNA hydrolase ArfB [Bacteroidia bacterium]|nr:alternative ribosome rescue aminoacyl-tRNA hydrolase ArfB [Bacteroidia bacterium]